MWLPVPWPSFLSSHLKLYLLISSSGLTGFTSLAQRNVFFLPMSFPHCALCLQCSPSFPALLPRQILLLLQLSTKTPLPPEGFPGLPPPTGHPSALGHLFLLLAWLSSHRIAAGSSPLEWKQMRAGTVVFCPCCLSSAGADRHWHVVLNPFIVSE